MNAPDFVIPLSSHPPTCQAIASLPPSPITLHRHPSIHPSTPHQHSPTHRHMHPPMCVNRKKPALASLLARKSDCLSLCAVSLVVCDGVVDIPLYADRQTDRHTGSKHTPTRASPAHGRKLSRTRHSATNLYVAADSCGSPLPHGLDQSRSTSYTVLLTATSAAPRSTPGAIGSDPVSEAEERDGQRSHSVRQCGTADVAGTAYRQTDKSTHSVIQTYREKSQVATDTGRRSSTRVSSRGEQEVYSARWCFGQPAGPNCTTHTNTTATRDRFASHRHPILATCVGPARPGQATKYALTHA